MNCPVCNVNLLMSEKQGIEIDYCPKCRGIWLDRGELEKIIERSNAEMPRNEERDYKRDDYKKDDYKKPFFDDDNKHKGGFYHKKKKSFFDDIFDF